METVIIVDVMAAVHRVQVSQCKTFGDLGCKIITTILSQGFSLPNTKRLDIVFDKYDEMSPKSGERMRRRNGADPLEIVINGPATVLPVQWKRYLATVYNKQQLTAFLAETWCCTVPSLLQHGQEVVIAGGFNDSER